VSARPARERPAPVEQPSVERPWRDRHPWVFVALVLLIVAMALMAVLALALTVFFDIVSEILHQLTGLA
jgi:hypothetical protein